MRFPTLSLSLSLAALLSATLSSALPAPTTTATTSQAPTDFYLVTSDQATPSTNSSQLQGVSATTPFNEAPLSGTTLLLRLLEPGYNSLPSFTFTPATSTLSTTLTSHGVPTQWNSSAVSANSALQFVASQQKANLGLGGEGEYLLTVDGKTEGWTVCKSQTGQSVLWWMGEAEGCRKTFLHVVGDAPYLRMVRS
ncbi:hypothetical protein CC80DRAFT_308969 [Byssothecium circinans]|uniref:Ubiquitin 3 binding protein But2 C-terminal domain-containing protein n=1 Tax=Byssothecium circinans TaxID=147558 RepID=A0A6A5UA22_9PLEO|nr:hypothetical protein CC80DRAFT_308969 [Byssothecium circinans]